MYRTLFGLFTLGALIVTTTQSSAQTKDKDAAASKAALQALNEFIGQFKGDADPKDGKKAWKESMEWGWKIKGDDVALSVTFKDSPYFKSGLLKYAPDKKQYTLTAINAEDKEVLFTGEFKQKRLTFNSYDEKTKDRTEIVMSTNNDGARFIYSISTGKGEKGLTKKVVDVAHKKEGEAIAGAGGKKTECIVTGGTGTMTVTYNGGTYYVCCSGCRDEFNANPKKYVDEYLKNKKK